MKMKFLNTLQAGRGLAALAVVFHHAVISAEAFSGDVPNWIFTILEFGYLGVDFFFVLSGFIIYYAFEVSKPSAKQFIRSRFLRIYTPYLPIGLALGLAYVFVPSLSASDREWGWWASVTLLPSTTPPALSVAWTLQHELVFYTIFAFLAYFDKVKVGMCVWAFLILSFWLAGPELPEIYGFLLAPINLEFSFGVFVATIFMSERKMRGGLMLGVIFISLFFALGADRSLSPIFGAGLAFVLLYFVSLERNRKIGTPAWLVFLGAASYSIYLVHNPLLSITSRLVDGWVMSLIIGAAASVLLGSLYYLAIEKRSQTWLQTQKSHADR